MAWYDGFAEKVGQTIAGMMGVEKHGVLERDYYAGAHPRQLKTKEGQYDDNLVLNYIGLAISRSVSRLFNGGVDFKLPDQGQQDYIDDVWDTNKQEQLLYQLGLNGTTYGTPFLKIMPDAKRSKKTGNLVPRLVALDPEITWVECNPFDVDDPELYRVEFTIGENGYREITRKAKPEDYPEMGAEQPSTWIVEHFILSRKTGGKWVPDPNNPPMEWPYDFPPIIHWKNLPSLKAVKGAYGSSDMEWGIGAQDKHNFGVSNINKTIRLNAAPPTIVTGVSQTPSMSTGPGSLSWFSDPNTKVFNLAANADINGSRAFAADLQSAIFTLMREVPPAVIQQLGSGLTNFVMRVIYADALDKTDTQREMYGDALIEINRRLLVIAGADSADPGVIIWHDALAANPTEQIAEDKFLLDMGLASKATIADHYGIDYEAEKGMIDAEAAASTGNVGAFLLQNFNQGG